MSRKEIQTLIDGATYAIIGLLCSIFVVLGIAALQRIIPKLTTKKPNKPHYSERHYEGKPYSNDYFDLTTLEDHSDIERVEHGYKPRPEFEISGFHKLLISLGIAKLKVTNGARS